MKIFVCLFLGVASSVYGQQTFTDWLQKSVQGEGRVTLHHDNAGISHWVNGTKGNGTMQTEVSRGSTSNRQVSVKHVKDSIPPIKNVDHGTKGERMDTTIDGEKVASRKPLRRFRTNGYRIQVYAGGNSRSARTEAERMAAMSKSLFPELPVYTHFYPPRWVCRVGDFKTMAEADHYLLQLKKNKSFGEASIVKTQIFAYY